MEYKYRLVMFISDKKEKEIDIVPTSWLENDEATDTLLCKFMPQPYTKKTISILHKMLKNCEKPLDEWPSFPVDLRGRASTYEEAEEKALLLEQKPYAYSTDSEKNAKKKAIQDKKSFKFKSLPLKDSLVLEKLSDISFDLNDNLMPIEVLEKEKSKNVTQATKTEIPRKKPSRQKLSDPVESSEKESSDNTSLESLNNSSIASPIKQNSQKSSGKFVAIKKKDILSASTSKHSEGLNSFQTDIHPQKCSTAFGNAKKNLPSTSTNQCFEDRLFKFFGEKLNSLNYKIGQIQGQILDLSAALNSIQNSIQTIKPTNDDIIDWNKNFTEEVLDFSLPCRNHDEFNKLNEEIATSEQFRKKLIRQILLSINKKTGLRRNMGQIIRKYMSRDLALSFTTSKAVTGKHVFSESKLYLCLKDAVSSVFKEEDGANLTEPTFKESVRIVFNNAKDWDGQGNIRKKNAQKT
ncbi:uncharacterized protein [Venturia canescens]|uniref:uncharacterized protein n=1 Tax=Venturia canescens TaxID=32260 RepID=UPI001C9CAAF0|nr:uncharacterized protein LOC122405846 [Venturia canescens]XP_043273667.1 uncharacterized protein LOC122409857 [Venturia canescens]XP_043286441.1 uncharacterized protein LOC122417181 [Venturia canescens]